MEHSFELSDERPIGDEFLLMELQCDTGRARTANSRLRKQFGFYLDRTVELFGNVLNDLNLDLVKEYPDGKYRHYWKVRKKGTDEIYTIYTCYFWWRIGGNDCCAHLGELMEILNPTIYAGYSGKTFEEITGRPGKHNPFVERPF
ncbi:MAG: hypothetical protein WDA20_13950 [Desulfuromonadales bacterium]